MESVRNDLYSVLAKNSGNDFDKIVELCENGDNFMKPNKVIELGFGDSIIIRKN